MKAPLAWLRDFVAIEMDVEELASRLALSGTEVERVVEVGVPGGADNTKRFVVGKIKECKRHPDADRLSVCLVNVGEDRMRTIVCGAPNVAAGQTVPVVLPGGVLPDGVVIKEAMLRGVRSAGMILSEAELGLAAKSEGILVLPDEWSAGELLSKHLTLGDFVLEVEVTPNRPDCLSIRGLAREIAVITEAAFDEGLSFAYPQEGRAAQEDIVIEVLAPDLCPRYAGRVIRGVSVQESPLWLKARLCHAGLRPISNAVDVTNYVQWTLGQPLHAFDLRSIRGGKIVVRRARPNESLVTLDNERRVLTEDMLVIADAEEASVVAGIMGGLDSEITASTTDILLEGANFSGPSIMRTSGALGLRSEASTRYEKGLDPEMIDGALDLACGMLVELCGGTVSKGTVDVRTPPRPRRELELRDARLEHVLGTSVRAEVAEALLSRLGCTVSRKSEGFQVIVPSFRADLEREIDLIEEVARIQGLEEVPATLPSRQTGRGGLTQRQRQMRRIEDLMAGAGLEQVVTYSFADEKWPGLLGLGANDPRRAGIAITNPLSSDQSVMRSMLLPGLLATARRNMSVHQESVPVFELGRIYLPSGQELPQEPVHLGMLVAGEWGEESWWDASIPNGYFLGKGLVERLARGLHIRLGFSRGGEAFLHPGRSAMVSLSDGDQVGWLGEVHPSVVEQYDLRGVVVAAELDVDVLLGGLEGETEFRDLLAFPAVEQDVALVMDSAVPVAALVDSVRRAGGDLLEEVRIFDVYDGDQIDAGKKSIALRLRFRASDRTLSEAEINRLRVQMLASVSSEVGAKLRG